MNFSLSFLHPRYWFIWTCYGLLRVINFLPYRLQIIIGECIGRISMYISKKRRNIAQINLKLCFPEWTDAERNKVLWQHAELLGISIIEFGISYWWSDKRFKPLFHVEGIENLYDALKQGNGVILLLGHFTTLEVIGRILILQTDNHPMYRKNNNPLIDYLITSNRLKYVSKVIPHDEVRSLIRSLQCNKPVVYIPDQNFGRKHSIFVPFFGIKTATLPTTSRLAAIYNSPVIPLRQARSPGLKGYKLIFEKALDNFPGENLEHDAYRINKIFEQQVRDDPVNYLWVHRRFKTRPEGEDPIY